MKFEECNDPIILRDFAKFLMGQITEMYESIDEAWEVFMESV